MSEQVKNGQNVELDGVIVKNDISLVEKKEEVEKAPEVEAKDEFKPDKVISNGEVTSEEKAEQPVAEPAAEPTVKETEAPISEQPTVIPTPQETQDAKVNNSTVDFDAISSSLGGPSINFETPPISADPIQSTDVSYSNANPTTPLYEAPVENNVYSLDGLSNNASLGNFGNTNVQNEPQVTSSNDDLYSSAYDSVINETKTIAAVVTEQDQAQAKKAYMDVSEKIYDAGPGKQISILRNFSAEAAKWIRAAATNGFINGEMHDIAKNILREYEGLKKEYDDFYDDNKIVSFPSSYNEQPVNQFDNFSGTDNDKVIQYSQSDNNDMGGNGNLLAS